MDKAASWTWAVVAAAVCVCVVVGPAVGGGLVHTTARLSVPRHGLAATSAGTKALFAGGRTLNDPKSRDVITKRKIVRVQRKKVRIRPMSPRRSADVEDADAVAMVSQMEPAGRRNRPPSPSALPQLRMRVG